MGCLSFGRGSWSGSGSEEGRAGGMAVLPAEECFPFPAVRALSPAPDMHLSFPLDRSEYQELALAKGRDRFCSESERKQKTGEGPAEGAVERLHFDNLDLV